MLWTICVILFVLWALGMVTSYTMGGIVHILLVLAIAVVAFAAALTAHLRYGRRNFARTRTWVPLFPGDSATAQ